MTALVPQPPGLGNDSNKPQLATTVTEIPSASVGVPEFEQPPLTIDQLIRTRKAVSGGHPILAYPSSGINYVDYTTKDLDGYAYHAANQYGPSMPKRSSSTEKPAVVALLGPSNMDYVVSMMALTKLGHTVLYLSPRISEEAHRSLLEKTGAQDIVIHPSFKSLAASLQSSVEGLRVHDIVDEKVWRKQVSEDTDTRMDHHLDPQKENKYVAWIIHSSGSTSLPKPVYLYHFAVLSNYRVNNIPMKGYITMPLYHSHGVANLFKSFYSGKKVHLYNADLPLASRYLVGTMHSYHFDIFHGVPYVLKLLSEHEEGVKLLAQCKVVMFGGSSCPDSLGDYLTERGVFLVSHYGTTETGQLMTSERSPSDKLWNWVRPSAKSRPFVSFEDRGSGLFEIICHPGWPGKVMTNRDDGSYATRDLFTKHPTIEGLYKYYSRLDDTLTLVNGEKANPLLIEGLVRQNAEVKEAVAFGAGRARIGLLLFPSATGACLTRDDLLDRIWPSIEKAQQDMPDFSHLSKDMIEVLPEDADYRKTDKGTIIRQAVYKEYETVIESMYSDEGEGNGTLDISGDALHQFLQEQVQKILDKVDKIEIDADFFALGLDSLKATQLRSIILSSVQLKGAKLGLNIAFDYPSIHSLAKKLEMLRIGANDAEPTATDEMADIITRYGQFSQSIRQNVLLTGVTGSLGAHVASLLAQREDVDRVYCLVRASQASQAHDRLIKSLSERRLLAQLGDGQVAKFSALPSDLSLPSLGLEAETLDEISRTVTVVIHSAWSVNFNLRLSSFIGDCIVGARHLMNLCLSSQRRASFSFCSSVSTVANSPESPISESVPSSPTYAQNIGYAQSKLVTEQMCMNASSQAGLTSRVLRIGQICGDTQHGVWNATEAFPLIFQSALTTGKLPQINETPRWLPLDTVASTVVDLSMSHFVPTGVYNIINPQAFHWTKDLLPLIRDAGLEFEEVKPSEWVQAVQSSKPDPDLNPPYKLAEFFAQRYGGTNSTGRPPATWDTRSTSKYSPAFRDAPVLSAELVSKMVKYWTQNDWAKSTGSRD